MSEGMGGLPDDISFSGLLAGDGGSEPPPWLPVFIQEGITVTMENRKKGLSSFQTFWIFGCGVGFFGVILKETSMIWSGLFLIAIGVVAGIFKK